MTNGSAPGLTEQELRLMALRLEGLSTEELANRLGLPTETVEAQQEAIRSKLTKGGTETLDDAIRQRMQFSPEEPLKDEASAPLGEAERRVRLLLRLTLNEVLGVAMDAEVRASMLGDIVSRMGSEDESSAKAEVEALRHVASVLRQSVSTLTEEIRKGGSR